jgi:hypothetical protein
MQELECKYKKLNHKLFAEDVDELPEPIEKPADENRKRFDERSSEAAPTEVIEDEVAPQPLPRPETRQYPVRRADLLNYKRFGF